jgi:hypothetical protein
VIRFRLEPIFATALDASKNDARFKSGQKWSLACIVSLIIDTLYKNSGRHTSVDPILRDTFVCQKSLEWSNAALFLPQLIL